MQMPDYCGKEFKIGVGQQPELTKRVLCDYACALCAPYEGAVRAEDIVDWIVKQEILADWQSSRAG